MSIFQGVLEEELERNLRKQDSFRNELQSLPKGYLSTCRIEGVDYIYRKHRDGKKIVSQLIMNIVLIGVHLLGLFLMQYVWMIVNYGQ